MLGLRPKNIAIVVLIVLWGISCSTPPTDKTHPKPAFPQKPYWTVRGKLSNEKADVDSALALSSDGDVTEVDIGAGKSLALNLKAGASYALYFRRQDALEGVLFFQENRTAKVREKALYLPNHSALPDKPPSNRESLRIGNLKLGQISLERGIATPENNPNRTIDRDNDGTPDFDDSDDDGDDTTDRLDADEDFTPTDTRSLGFIVEDTDPEPYEEVDPDTEIEIEFNQSVKPDSLTAETLMLQRSDGTSVPYSPQLEDEGQEVTITPDTRLTGGQTYRIKPTAQIQTSDGSTLAPITIPFNVESEEDEDESPDTLQITRAEPADVATDIDRDVEIRVRFNQPLAPSTVTAGESFQLSKNGTSVPGELEVDDSEIRFSPSDQLVPGTEYQYRLTTGIESLDGDSLGQTTQFDFQTESDGEEEDDG